MIFLGGSETTFTSSSRLDMELSSNGCRSPLSGDVDLGWLFLLTMTGLGGGGDRNVESFEVVWCAEDERYTVMADASTAKPICKLRCAINSWISMTHRNNQIG